MRAILETHLSCAGCGQELTMVYEHEIDKEQWKKIAPMSLTSLKSTNTSGGFKVESRVFVEPCSTCLLPAKRVMEAVTILQGISRD